MRRSSDVHAASATYRRPMRRSLSAPHLLALPLAAAATLAAAAAAPAASFSRSHELFTVAGNGHPGRPVPGATAAETPFEATDVAALPAGGALVADAAAGRVLRIDAYGIVRVVAGNGSTEVTGDGGRATEAGLGAVRSVAVMPDGGFVLSDARGSETSYVPTTRLRRVWPDGTITTMAGGDRQGFSGDGGPAVQGLFQDIWALSALPDGSVLVADEQTARVRRVWPDGIIRTVAGNGRKGFPGDPVLATESPIGVTDVEGLPDGGFLVGACTGYRIARVSTDGVMRSVAGNGEGNPTYDGRSATATSLNNPCNVAASPDGSIWIGDPWLRRVGTDGVLRRVTTDQPACRQTPPEDFAGTTSVETLTGPGTGIFIGEGRRSPCAAIVVGPLAATPDGGVLVVPWVGQVRYVAPLHGARLPAAAITATRVVGGRVAVRYTTTIAGRARLELRRDGRTVTVARALAAHHGSITASAPGRSGVFRARLTVRSAAGATASSDVGVLIGALTPRIARAALANFFADYSFGQFPDRDARPSYDCRAMGHARVDCALSARPDVNKPQRGCVVVHAVQVGPSGLPAFRPYTCRAGSRGPYVAHPRWLTRRDDPLVLAERWVPFAPRTAIPAPLLR